MFSGKKYAHSIITDLVLLLHEVLLPPTMPAKFTILLSNVNTKFSSSKFISFSLRVSNFILFFIVFNSSFPFKSF